jgi:hypothetical protein
LAEYIPTKAEFNEKLILSLHGEPEPEPVTESEPSFDGGVRETAPPPSDPRAEHDQLLVDWLRGR